ncbi:ESX secretion-associated protein EspG [Gordonia sp. N1V]|uniref:ESX secretion-associated protein EspG n=1 Tax=Gordonia sp. N1V TaxID=3034163 RepID=UPI0023E33C38|nr:ESX secretion-associated protein EspG [Gordonia sp. N1V]MDF3282333.1 ESX secretion-associated protein EspG [Gordonia sp. N1V]
MIVTSTDSRRLEIAVVRRLGQRCGVTTWPVVLDLWTPAADGAHDEPRGIARDLADPDNATLDRVIAQAGLFDSSGPTLWADTVLGVLAHPDRELEIRGFATESTVRACVARRGHDHVLAVRRGDHVELAVLDVRDTTALAGVVRATCGPHDALDFTETSVPTRELTERLGHCADAPGVVAALRAWGATAADATRVADALLSCDVRWEIVATSRADGVLTQTSGAIGIIDSRAGRILMGLSRSPDDRLWTTITPGTGHRIGAAVDRLIDTLPGQRWFP